MRHATAITSLGCHRHPSQETSYNELPKGSYLQPCGCTSEEERGRGDLGDLHFWRIEVRSYTETLSQHDLEAQYDVNIAGRRFPQVQRAEDSDSRQWEQQNRPASMRGRFRNHSVNLEDDLPRQRTISWIIASVFQQMKLRAERRSKIEGLKGPSESSGTNTSRRNLAGPACQTRSMRTWKSHTFFPKLMHRRIESEISP